MWVFFFSDDIVVICANVNTKGVHQDGQLKNEIYITIDQYIKLCFVLVVLRNRNFESLRFSCAPFYILSQNLFFYNAEVNKGFE